MISISMDPVQEAEVEVNVVVINKDLFSLWCQLVVDALCIY